jgi:hypothetical protein
MVKKGISWLAITAVMAHARWLNEIHGEFFIWLIEQRKHRFCRVPQWGRSATNP